MQSLLTLLLWCTVGLFCIQKTYTSYHPKNNSSIHPKHYKMAPYKNMIHREYFAFKFSKAKIIYTEIIAKLKQYNIPLFRFSVTLIDWTTLRKVCTLRELTDACQFEGLDQDALSKIQESWWSSLLTYKKKNFYYFLMKNHFKAWCILIKNQWRKRFLTLSKNKFIQMITPITWLGLIPYFS